MFDISFIKENYFNLRRAFFFKFPKTFTYFFFINLLKVFSVSGKNFSPQNKNTYGN